MTQMTTLAFEDGPLKTCFKCGKHKPTSQFYPHKAMSDGLLGKCKTCTRLDVYLNRKAKLERYLAYDAARAKTPERRAYVTALTKKYRALYPEKYKARTAVSNAIRSGKLRKGTCVRCGAEPETTRMQAHHYEGYDNPLHILWMCGSCHRSVHRLERRESC